MDQNHNRGRWLEITAIAVAAVGLVISIIAIGQSQRSADAAVAANVNGELRAFSMALREKCQRAKDYAWNVGVVYVEGKQEDSLPRTIPIDDILILDGQSEVSQKYNLKEYIDWMKGVDDEEEIAFENLILVADEQVRRSVGKLREIASTYPSDLVIGPKDQAYRVSLDASVCYRIRESLMKWYPMRTQSREPTYPRFPHFKALYYVPGQTDSGG